MIATLELVDKISYHKSIKGPELEGDGPVQVNTGVYEKLLPRINSDET